MYKKIGFGIFVLALGSFFGYNSFFKPETSNIESKVEQVDSKAQTDVKIENTEKTVVVDQTQQKDEQTPSHLSKAAKQALERNFYLTQDAQKKITKIHKYLTDNQVDPKDLRQKLQAIINSSPNGQIDIDELAMVFPEEVQKDFKSALADSVNEVKKLTNDFAQNNSEAPPKPKIDPEIVANDNNLKPNQIYLIEENRIVDSSSTDVYIQEGVE